MWLKFPPHRAEDTEAIFPVSVIHEDLALEDVFDPRGALLEMINDPLCPGSNGSLAWLNFPPHRAEGTEEKTAGHLNSLMGSSIDFVDFKIPKVSV